MGAHGEAHPVWLEDHLAVSTSRNEGGNILWTFGYRRGQGTSLQGTWWGTGGLVSN